MPDTTLRGISSMATRQVLGELAAAYQAPTLPASRGSLPPEGADSPWGGPAANASGGDARIQIESVGGVDAAKRVQAGEAFDLVFLAADAIDKLIATGAVVAGSRVDLVRSGVAVAVRAGAARPDLGSEESVKRAVLAAPTVGYSTGPSGVALVKMFERWGIAKELEGRLVQAPAGVPVGSLVAKGDVALGFQQLSELMSLQGIDVVGALPDAIQIVTTFSGAVCAASQHADKARAVLAFMASAQSSEIKRRNGMDPA